MRNSQSDIAAAVRREAAARSDKAVERVVAGTLLVGVQGTHVGLCTNIAGESFTPESGGTLHGLLSGLEVTGLDGRAASLAVAAAGALLPPPPVSGKKAQDIVLERGRGRRVVVVGHFPFVEKMGPAFASFCVLERSPRPGDLPAGQAETVLPEAQVVAITASALANGSLGSLLDLCAPEAFVLLVGPSTPFAVSLFEFGIDVLCGNRVTDAQAVLDGVGRGQAYRTLGGLAAVCAVREDFVKKIR